MLEGQLTCELSWKSRLWRADPGIDAWSWPH